MPENTDKNKDTDAKDTEEKKNTSDEDLERLKGKKAGLVVPKPDAELVTDGIVEVRDYRTYNPLHDFIYINGEAFAIRSILVHNVVEKTENETKVVEVELDYAWRTYYTNEKGELRIVWGDNLIGGNFILPLFSADEFHDNATKGLLKHRYTLGKRDLMKVPEIKKVFQWTENAVKSVLTVPDDERKLLVCWIIAAHFHRVFNQFPPLIFKKTGSDAGGTVGLVACSLAPYPVSIFDPTEATLFRLAQMGFSELIDEIHPEDREKIRILNLMLDGSFSKDATIPRATGQNFSVEPFSPYGPKVCIDPYVAMVKYSTTSRSARIYLRKDPIRSERPNMGEFIDKHRGLVQSLYDLFLPYAHRVRKAYDGITEFKGRPLQAFSPILAIAELVDCKYAVMQTLQSLVDDLQMQRANDPIKFVLRSVYEFFVEVRKDIEFSDFSRSRDKNSYRMEFAKLREILKERVLEIHQTDESSTFKDGVEYTSKRQWRKIPTEFIYYFDGSRFNEIIRSNLKKWVVQVRGDRDGLELPANVDEGFPIDPLLDELERVLEIKNSYKDAEKEDAADDDDDSKGIPEFDMD